MSYSWSSTPTISTSGKTVSVTSNSWDFPGKFVTQVDNGSECVLKNIDSSKIAPTTVTFKAQSVKNVYSGTGINPLYNVVNKTGSQVLCKLENPLIDTAFGANSDTKVLPLSGHFVLRAPNDAAVTDQMVSDFVDQCVATLANEAGSIKDRLAAMVRGALNPRV